MSTPPERLTVGRIVRPHGLRGEVTVDVLTDAPDERFQTGARFTLTSPDGTRHVTVAAARQQAGRLLLKFAEFDGREAVERVRGGELTIPAAEARPLGDGEYWPHQLVGLDVLDAAGERRGVVTDVVPGTAHDFLEVERSSGGRVLIPAVAALAAVDLDARTVTVAPVAGLLDPDE